MFLCLSLSTHVAQNIPKQYVDIDLFNRRIAKVQRTKDHETSTKHEVSATVSMDADIDVHSEHTVPPSSNLAVNKKTERSSVTSDMAVLQVESKAEDKQIAVKGGRCKPWEDDEIRKWMLVFKMETKEDRANNRNRWVKFALKLQTMFQVDRNHKQCAYMVCLLATMRNIVNLT